MNRPKAGGSASEPSIAVPFVGGPFCGNVCAAFGSQVPIVLPMPGCEYRLSVTLAKDGEWVQIRYVVSARDFDAKRDGKVFEEM
jgi:hypothetical protein